MVARCLIWGVIGLFMWQTASSQSRATTGKGLKGEYFDGTNYERKVFTRIDPQIDFDWEWTGSPGPGINHSFYSIRWTGNYRANSGIYKFTATVDDGIRLWVGGKKVIDVWRLNDNQTFKGKIRLTAGQYYDFRVDYFNDIRGGSISLYWIPPNETGQTALSGNYLYTPTYRPPKTVVAKTTEKPTPVKPRPRVVVIRESPMPKTIRKDTVATQVSKLTKTTKQFEGLKTGDELVLNQVYFDQSEYRLLPESYTELNKLVRAMTQNPRLQIEIGGHTDNVGDPRLNLALSENRANVITTYLVRNGVDNQRIEAKGYGGTRPIADNATEAGRAKNRRVEFMVK